MALTYDPARANGEKAFLSDLRTRPRRQRSPLPSSLNTGVYDVYVGGRKGDGGTKKLRFLLEIGGVLTPPSVRANVGFLHPPIPQFVPPHNLYIPLYYL